MDQLAYLWNTFGDFAQKVLPHSPFQPYIEQFAELPYLGYLNWFFPIADAIGVTAAWLTAIGVYYIYSAILRWVKVIS